MSGYNVHCGCVNPHAVTKVQRQYAKRALQVAYSTRNGAAIAKIKDALAPCSAKRANKEFATLASLIIENRNSNL
jgi:hypothetical protein